MLQTVRGTYRDGKIHLTEPGPADVVESDVLVTFLAPAASPIDVPVVKEEVLKPPVEAPRAQRERVAANAFEFQITSDVPRQQLAGMIALFGRNVCRDRPKCETLIRNLCGSQCAEFPLLAATLELGLPEDLIALQAGEAPAAVLDAWTNRLVQDEQWPEPAARWAVDSWAVALRIVTPKRAAAPAAAAVPTSSPVSQSSAAPPAASASVVYVGNWQAGEFTTIEEAVKAAAPNGRIIIRPGSYRESIVLTRPVEIVSDGSVNDVVIEGREGPAIRVESNGVVVRGLTLRGNDLYAVEIVHGDAVFEDCDISARWPACVGVLGPESSPVLRRCRVHDGHQFGILMTGGAGGTIQQCEVFGMVQAGIVIEERSDPHIIDCQIHDGKASGVSVLNSGLGTLEDCEISCHLGPGIEIRGDSSPTLRSCKVRDGGNRGILVTDGARGVIDNCEISGNSWAGLAIEGGASPDVRQTLIHNGAGCGVTIYNGGRGRLEECDIFLNELEGLVVAGESDPHILRCRIHDSIQSAVHFAEGSQALMEGCDITRSGAAGVVVDRGANPTILHCTIRECQGPGLILREGALGRVQACAVSQGEQGAMQVEPGTMTSFEAGRNAA